MYMTVCAKYQQQQKCILMSKELSSQVDDIMHHLPGKLSG